MFLDRSLRDEVLVLGSGRLVARGGCRAFVRSSRRPRSTRSRTGRFRSRRRLHLVETVPGLSSGSVRVVARVVPPDDDAGGDARHGRAPTSTASPSPTSTAGRCARAPGPRVLGRVRRSRLRPASAGAAPRIERRGRDDHRLAPSADLLVRDRPQPAARTAAGAYLIAEQRWIPRRMAVLHPPSEPLFSETGHWNSTCIACHATQRQARVRHAVRIAADRHAGRRDDGRRARHRLRGVPRAGRRSMRARTAIRCAATAAPDRPRRPDHRPADAARSAALVAGLRPVPRHLGVLRRSRRAARPTRAGLPYPPGDELTKTRFVAQPTRNGDAPTMQALLADDPGLRQRLVLAGRDGSRVGPRVQRPDRVALLRRTRAIRRGR